MNKYDRTHRICSAIASLIFVGMEIRQNTTAVRGATNQAISDQATELYLAMATNRNLASLTVKRMMVLLERF